jgi:tRNA pseudouridine38-40 synthase
MVRNMVRALARVGEGRYQPERIATIVDAKQRSASPGSAPSRGLYLMKVRYEPPL